MIQRITLIVLDSLGIGALPDAAAFGDQGADTLGHIAEQQPALALPHLCGLGLGRISALPCPDMTACSTASKRGVYGRMAERSAGKDTTTGHWELTGIVSERPFPTYPQGFPQDLIDAFEKAIGRRILGNYPRSGTVILAELGDQHLVTGRPIVYTSADSVFQVAAHVDVISIETLYEYCRAARRLLTGEHGVGRVIARPFRGEPGRFERCNDQRMDFSLPPPESLLDRLPAAGYFCAGVGKIGDIFAGRGLTSDIHTRDNMTGVDEILATLDATIGKRGMIFANLVDFDMVYGHRRDPKGYAEALMAFDQRLPEIFAAMQPGDLLILTADHGCDPTFGAHTDHTREYVPLLLHGTRLKPHVDLGDRETLADCGQTIADLLDLAPLPWGQSFTKEILACT
ncbi:MAG: phosphopentomutase [Desulfosarcinaceae bacterium]